MIKVHSNPRLVFFIIIIIMTMAMMMSMIIIECVSYVLSERFSVKMGFKNCEREIRDQTGYSHQGGGGQAVLSNRRFHMGFFVESPP